MIGAIAGDFWNGLLDVVYPPKCLTCARFDRGPICGICRASFSAVAAPICDRCGRTKDGSRCADCATGVPKYLTKVRSAGHYDGPLREAIIQLKYHDKPQAAPILAGFLAEFLAETPFGSIKLEIVIPIPLHRSRLRERGFNQSELIAKQMAQELDLVHDPAILERTRKTRPQVDLPAEKRSTNVFGAFEVTDAPRIVGKTLLLVDDVATTTHTGDECARILKDAGAKAVYMATVARGG